MVYTTHVGGSFIIAIPTLDLLGYRVSQGELVSEAHFSHVQSRNLTAKAIMWQTSPKIPFLVSCCKIIVFGGWSFAASTSQAEIV